MGGLPAQSQAQQHYTVASLSRMKGRHHTPAHPARPTRHITGADRARAKAGGWTALSNVPNFPNGAGTEILMTDGTVMIADNCSALWYSLAPDASGNYATGTWTQKAAPSYAPLYFASAILPDGKLIINGGEYDQCVGKETTKGAIYDPVANTWTNVNPPSGWSQIGDAQSVVLNDGTYMIGNCCTSAQAQYNESTGAWTAVGNGKHDANSEEGWTLLPNGTVLAADVIAEPNSEAYNYSSNMWSTLGSVGMNLTSGEEIGPQTLRPNGEVWVAGGNGLSAAYNTKTNTWKAGPTFPVVGGQQLDVADGPSTVLQNGDGIDTGEPRPLQCSLDVLYLQRQEAQANRRAAERAQRFELPVPAADVTERTSPYHGLLRRRRDLHDEQTSEAQTSARDLVRTDELDARAELHR